MNNRQPDSSYTKKYDEKRQAIRLPLNFYQDDPIEKQIYDLLCAEKNKKQVILEALKKHYNISD